MLSKCKASGQCQVHEYKHYHKFATWQLLHSILLAAVPLALKEVYHRISWNYRCSSCALQLRCITYSLHHQFFAWNLQQSMANANPIDITRLYNSSQFTLCFLQKFARGCQKCYVALSHLHMALFPIFGFCVCLLHTFLALSKLFIFLFVLPAAFYAVAQTVVLFTCFSFISS